MPYRMTLSDSLIYYLTTYWLHAALNPHTYTFLMLACTHFPSLLPLSSSLLFLLFSLFSFPSPSFFAIIQLHYYEKKPSVGSQPVLVEAFTLSLHK
jgi:hypothetical protein